jgi:hypothetical protein
MKPTLCNWQGSGGGEGSDRKAGRILQKPPLAQAVALGQGTLTPIGFGPRMSPGAEIGSNARWQQGGAGLIFASREDGGSSEGEADR